MAIQTAPTYREWRRISLLRASIHRVQLQILRIILVLIYLICCSSQLSRMAGLFDCTLCTYLQVCDCCKVLFTVICVTSSHCSYHHYVGLETSPHAPLYGLPPGEINDIVPAALCLCSKRFMMISATVFTVILHYIVTHGSHATWKVVHLEKGIFQAWKVVRYFSWYAACLNYGQYYPVYLS